jgi:GntR family transcriptional regulator
MEHAFMDHHRGTGAMPRAFADGAQTPAAPLYARLRDHLRQQILTGTLRTNDRLPSELSLVAQFGVSRVTVRQALRALREEGLVRSAQGKGCFVSLPRGVQDSRSAMGFHQSMATLGFVAVSEVLSVVERSASAEVSQALGLRRRATVLELRRLRRLNGEPVSYEIRHFPDDVGRSLKSHDLTRDILPLLESCCGIRPGRAEVRIEAVPCRHEHVARLQLNRGDPVLSIYRLTLDARGRAVDYQRLYCRGDAYRFHCNLNLLTQASSWPGELAR